MTDEAVTRVAVVGSGYMGGGIAQTLALAGAAVTVLDRDPQLAAENLERLRTSAVAAEQSGLLPSGSGALVRERIRAGGALDELRDAELVMEAVYEDIEVKRVVLRDIEAHVDERTVIGTNTSAIPVTALAEVLVRPERFFGIHWYNPAPYLPGIELILGDRSDGRLLPPVIALLRAAGKDPVTVPDTPGFVANRLQFALFKEAATMVEEGLVTPKQLDAVVRSAFGFRLPFYGPFAIADMAGLDVYAAAYASLEDGLGDRFSCPPSLREYVEAGDYGIKTGGGYLGLSAEEAAAMVATRDALYAALGRLRDGARS